MTSTPFVACFDPEYRGEQPVHPDRAFVGSDQVRKNWGAIFEGVPDFHAELVRSAREGDVWWAEWHWEGRRVGRARLDMRGVTIFGVRDDRIIWGRLYLEDVEVPDADIDKAVQRMAGGTQ